MKPIECIEYSLNANESPSRNSLEVVLKKFLFGSINSELKLSPLFFSGVGLIEEELIFDT